MFEDKLAYSFARYFLQAGGKGISDVAKAEKIGMITFLFQSQGLEEIDA